MKLKPIQIMDIPERKKPCLFVLEEPNSYVHVATFRSEEAANKFAECFNRVIDEVLGVGVKEEK